MEGWVVLLPARRARRPLFVCLCKVHWRILAVDSILGHGAASVVRVLRPWIGRRLARVEPSFDHHAVVRWTHPVGR